jgi:hypothetical protein
VCVPGKGHEDVAQCEQQDGKTNFTHINTRCLRFELTGAGFTGDRLY